MTSSILSLFIQGWKLALARPVLAFLKWLLNMVTALILAFPIFQWLSEDLDHSNLPAQLNGQLDTLYVLEFLERFGGQLEIHRVYWLPFVLLFALLNIYLSGGILTSLNKGFKMAGPTFFSACQRHFATFFWIGLACAFLTAVLVLWPLSRMDDWYNYLEDHYPDGRLMHLSFWFGVMSILLFLFTLTARLYDYARIAVCLSVSEEGESDRVTLIRGMRHFGRALFFTLKHYFKSLTLWLTFFLFPIALYFVFQWLDLAGTFLPNAGPWFALGFGQVLLFMRIFSGIGRLGAEMRFFEGSAFHAPDHQRSELRSENTNEMVEHELME